MLPETKSKRTFVFRKYYEKYKHLWILLYFFVYMAWFNYLKKTVTTHFHVIHVPIDDYIPLSALVSFCRIGHRLYGIT